MDRRKKQKKSAWILLLVAVVLLGGLAFQFYHQKQVTKLAEQQKQQSAEKNKSAANKEENGKKQKSSPATAAKKDKEPAAGKKQSTAEKVDKLLKQMTLQEKVGQMFMVGFQSTEEDQTIQTMIRKQKVGGVILFDRNMQSPEQVAELTNRLKQEAAKNDVSLPLMIGLDQEGGPVLRMRDRVSPIPSQQRLGRTASPEQVYKVARLNGTELAAMGIQVDFAPVLDLSANDERSFGRDPGKTTTLGLEAVKGLNAAHVTASLKHFPGNGRVVVDPHLDESIVKADKATLENVDMVPFKRMMEKQAEQQFFVMVTHVKYPAFDAKMPASISRTIIQDVLRGQLGYQGIVVTDDLDMGAVSKYYSYDQLGYMAVNAGADLLLACHEYDHQLKLYQGILQAVQDGKLSEERINESVKRILTYKLEHVSNDPVSPAKASQIVRSPEHVELMESITK
ncbi:beta-N-acetylhexosaminidase [Neobacillus sp. YIM B02564]|jgi:beta-N-acetylhexosaminidase|uniref:beta-N-acetylhexosaminidase n=1 Tax=Neobacillus paridis TaxID=2803862 RepID=A0ABS1TTP2_9BACI|nr:beta-N-acetylhexosaminidase [Neobacillus paridis]MBL4954684.1 beta-N-acetylhexosaminidase [Neobacillus paridis]